MTNFFCFLLACLTLSFSAHAGSPEFDPYVKKMQDKFKNSFVPTESQLKVHQEDEKYFGLPLWGRCITRSAQGENIQYDPQSFPSFIFVDHHDLLGNTINQSFKKFYYAEDRSSLSGPSSDGAKIAYIRMLNKKRLIIEVVKKVDKQNLSSHSESQAAYSVSDPAKELDAYIECERRLYTPNEEFPDFCVLF